MSDQRKEKIVTARGVVTEALPSTLFRVKMEGSGEDEKEILAYLGGKMRMHRIKVLIGDSVEIVLDPYGGKGRIVKRL
ncbi:MAG: translation initiation factor IF-1 [Candidatus Paceibacterota bacterium]|jgi:translation initiation factor IF-1